jgi:quaternary ammonium compound-resistance protein SugE
VPALNPAAAWAVLLVAGLCEIAWAIGLKYTEGFTRLVPSVWTLAAMAASVVLLAWSLKTLPVGTAYAVWTGVGAVGTAILGMVLFNESREGGAPGVHRPDRGRHPRPQAGDEVSGRRQATSLRLRGGPDWPPTGVLRGAFPASAA